MAFVVVVSNKSYVLLQRKNHRKMGEEKEQVAATARSKRLSEGARCGSCVGRLIAWRVDGGITPAGHTSSEVVLAALVLQAIGYLLLLLQLVLLRSQRGYLLRELLVNSVETAFEALLFRPLSANYHDQRNERRKCEVASTEVSHM